MKTGIYIHIPYCVRKCDYCDFYSVTDTACQKAYFEAVRQEMETYFGVCIPVDSIYIGGGTPSVAEAEEIASLLKKIREIFAVTYDAEITMELNPKTFDEEKLGVYRDAGVNRISMGLQSANNDELLKLGRIHTAEDFLVSYQLLRDMGFHTVNTDIMYGLPDSSQSSLAKTLEFLSQLDCEHISAYALTLEKDAALYRRGYTFPDDDGVYLQYRQVCDALAQKYRHYEISNFVKQEMAPCRHNMKYWTREAYLGFGAAAHSFFEGYRWANVSDIGAYIHAVQAGEINTTKEYITPKDAMTEQLMLALRTDRGILRNEFPDSFFIRHATLLQKFLSAGYLMEKEDGFCLTEDGFFVSNSIISAIQAEIG